MKKFRKKPVVIEAEQWLGTDEQKEKFLADGVIIDIPSRDGSCLVRTLEGDVTCSFNDYIIKGVKGEYYTFKPDIFELAYDLEEGDADGVDLVEDKPIKKGKKNSAE